MRACLCLLVLAPMCTLAFAQTLPPQAAFCSSCHVAASSDRLPAAMQLCGRSAAVMKERLVVAVRTPGGVMDRLLAGFDDAALAELAEAAARWYADDGFLCAEGGE